MHGPGYHIGVWCLSQEVLCKGGGQNAASPPIDCTLHEWWGTQMMREAEIFFSVPTVWGKTFVNWNVIFIGSLTFFFSHWDHSYCYYDWTSRSRLNCRCRSQTETKSKQLNMRELGQAIAYKGNQKVLYLVSRVPVNPSSVIWNNQIL